MAQFSCKFSDHAELSDLRLQYEVLCLGFVFDLLSLVCRYCHPEDRRAGTGDSFLCAAAA